MLMQYDSSRDIQQRKKTSFCKARKRKPGVLRRVSDRRSSSQAITRIAKSPRFLNREKTLSITLKKPQIKGNRREKSFLGGVFRVSMCETSVIKRVYGQSMGSLDYAASSVERDPTKALDMDTETCTTAGRDNDENTANGKRKRGQGAKKPRTKHKKGLSWRQSNRSRRLIANARERSRIHIMSEAFEGLRRAVPSYSSDQKLSKLAILRLATSYISALSYLAENDTSSKSLKHFAESVDQCTQALQTEGRAKRKE